MKIKWNILAIAALLLPLFLSNCGSNSSISGVWLNNEYEASIRSVDITAGSYGIASNVQYVQGVAPGENTLTIAMTMEPYYGYYTDQLTISVFDMRIIQPGTYYPIGYNGVFVRMILDGSVVTPTGTVMFTKFSLYYGREVCGEFDLYASDGRQGEFHGTFCGSVQVGYDN